jgi:hypothetical protein
MTLSCIEELFGSRMYEKKRQKRMILWE